MKSHTVKKTILSRLNVIKNGLAILIDPDKFDIENTATFLRKLPSHTAMLFVGGSTVPYGMTKDLIDKLKLFTAKPIVLFPGDVSQIVPNADGLLFLSLVSGRNPEYLIGQQIKAVQHLKQTELEVIPTAYLLIDGGNISAVEGVTGTSPMSQNDITGIVDTATASEYLGMKLVYLEAGSGALNPVRSEIIAAVKEAISIPLLVGGGIRTEAQKQAAYDAGADLVVMGTAFEYPSALQDRKIVK
ncbi:geranylgeranylglyceryl/heptaprenylglyceryl phosphate synthase [Constantimarinum furrinae]|uniref:Geranylgeranylglyceryl phosphate synthase n=1 Tax=Constantimarinum furrinae TaxID=2562285 RepID=A0A7G8PSE0_9FLAO|nr:geranylgeranylglyceryl/heptaprenylglyceryl phosphate synthase [Constantimarinum furrinae]QNJ97256.1 Phosphoglycerol geranylgeranyltransferase [Constantimarinum furrinae]